MATTMEPKTEAPPLSRGSSSAPPGRTPAAAQPKSSRKIVFGIMSIVLLSLLIFAALYLFARWATATDLQILRILLNASKFKRGYDPLKRPKGAFQRRGCHD